MNRFYTPEPLEPGEFVLDGPEAHHLVSVRRLGPGDRVTLFNGNGLEYPAEVVHADRKRATLNVFEAVAVDRERAFPLTIAAAMPKGDRGDFLVEKLVELGATRFVPLLAERSVVQPKESRLEKLQQAVIEASKQCGRNALMRIDALTRWSDFLTRAEGWRAILHPGSSEATAPPNAARTFAIGPEGGFTEGEVAAAEAAGWVRFSIGPRILRVETAAIAAACQ